MPARRSATIGLRLWGMADEPFWPSANGSSASRTSVRWRVPTAPEMVRTAPASRAAASRGRSRSKAKAWPASLRPKVVGSAATPWVRPRQRVSRCSRARSRTAAISRSSRRASRSQARVSCRARVVSSWWTRSEEGAGASSMAARSAGGTSPLRALALTTASSTSTNSRKRVASLQIAPISGSVYRGIMALQPETLGQLVLELLQLEAEPGVADGQDLHGQDAGVGGGVKADGGHRHPRGHLDDREQRVLAGQLGGEDRQPDHRQGGVGGQHPREGGRLAGGGDDDLEPAVDGAGPVVGHPAGVAVGAQDLQLVLDAELLQHDRRGLGLLLVRGRAEHDPNPWRHERSLIDHWWGILERN